MRTLDLGRWAIVGVKNETGVGRMAKDLRRCLHPVRQLVLPSYRLPGQVLDSNEVTLFQEDSDAVLRAHLSELQGIIVFDDSEFTRRVARLSHEMGLRSVYIVLWEWLRAEIPELRLYNLLACPNQFALEVAQRFKFEQAKKLTWPLNLEPLPKRSITSCARRFVHNVGLFEADDRKGTAITLEAFRRVSCPDVELVVQVQNELPLPLNDPRIRVESRNLESHGTLYELGDVAIQPSKCEGLGFMLLEALASGLPVVTTDYPPMNEYVRNHRMLARTRWGRKDAEQTHYIPQAHFKIPDATALAKRIAWCARHDLGPICVENRAWAEATFQPKRVRDQWIAALEELL